MNFVEGPEAAKFDAATIGIRPEHITLSKTGGTWKGKVGVTEHLGSDTFLHINTEVGTMTVRAEGDSGFEHGDDVGVSPIVDKIHRFDANDLAVR
jgi:multiple sugar transport system ATP-binding protein